MPDYSATTANIPNSDPRALSYDLTHDDATDRDAATPEDIAGAHITVLRNEIAALWDYVEKVTGLQVLDNGGIQIAYTAGRILPGSGVPVTVNAGTVNLTDDATNYVYVTSAGTVAATTSAPTAEKLRLATVVCASGDISSVTDTRCAYQIVTDVPTLTFLTATELTISGGTVTATQTAHTIDTEGDAASDDLDTISGGADGNIVIIRAENTARTVVVKHNTGNILLGGADIILDDTDQAVLLFYEGTLSKWLLTGTTGGGDMLTTTYDTVGGTDGKIDAAAGGTGIDSSALTGVAKVLAGTWSTEAQVALARGGTGQDFSVTPIGSVIAFNVANTSSILTGAVDGDVLTVQADGTLAFEATPGTGDMTKAVFDSDNDGLIDTAAGGLELDTSALTGYPYDTAGTFVIKKCDYAAVAAPTVNEDSVSGYALGSLILDTVGDHIYACVDPAAGAAVWRQLDAAVQTHNVFSTTHPDTATVVYAQGQVPFYNGAALDMLDPSAVAGYFLQSRGAGENPVWASGAGQSNHTLDSAQHQDVTAIAEARGMLLMYGAAPSKWRGLACGATAGMPLLSGGTGADLAYGTLGAVYGGTGIDASGLTGVVKITGGTWATEAQLAAARGGTGQNFSASSGLLELTAGAFAASLTRVTTIGATGSDTNIPSEQAVREALTDSEVWIIVKVIDDAVAVTTGDGKKRITLPSKVNGYNLTSCDAHVYTASTAGTPTIQIYNETQAADMLTTGITIDINETDSSTAAVPSVIDTNNDDVATANVLRFDIDVAGTSTAGTEVRMRFEKP